MSGRPTGAPALETLEGRLVPASLPGVHSLTPAIVQHETPGVYDPSSGIWYLRSSTDAGPPDAGKFLFGGPGYSPVVGDWDGDGISGIGAVSDATWYIRQTGSAGPVARPPFEYGLPNWKPLAGDWTGAGHDGIGEFDPTTGTWYLRSQASNGAADAGVFAYGLPGWTPVVGDWNGDGQTGIGVYDPSTATFYLRDSASGGAADHVFQFGAPGWTPAAGNWDGDGRADVAVLDPGGLWHVRTGATQAESFSYGLGDWVPVAGSWRSDRPLLAQGAVALPVPALTQAQLDTMVTAAYARLNVDELSDAVRQDIYATRFVVADLGPGVLSRTDRATHTVSVSPDAAYRGWFVDTTPLNDSEFGPGGKGRGGAASRVDLLSAVTRELAGLSGRSTAPALPAGVRRIA